MAYLFPSESLGISASVDRGAEISNKLHFTPRSQITATMNAWNQYPPCSRRFRADADLRFLLTTDVPR